MTKVQLTLQQLALCAMLATSTHLPKKVANVFALWCMELVEAHSDDTQVMEALQQGASPILLEILQNRVWRERGIVPWDLLMRRLNELGCTLAQFLVTHLRPPSAFHPVRQADVANRSFPVRQADVAYRSVPRVVEKPSVSPDKLSPTEPGECWDRLNRNQKAQTLLGKVVKQVRLPSHTPQYRHLANVLNGHRARRRKLTMEEQALVAAVKMSEEEKIAIAALLHFQSEVGG